MTEDAPHLPFGEPLGRPKVRLSVDGGDVIASGTLILSTSNTLKIQISDLELHIKFDDTTKKQGVKNRIISAKVAELTLCKFDNTLGTSLNNAEIGSIAERKIFLSLFVKAVGDKIKVLSYNILWGEQNG